MKIQISSSFLGYSRSASLVMLFSAFVSGFLVGGSVMGFM